MVNIFEKFEHTFAIKSVDKENRLIRGIASLEEEDRDNEIIALSAIDHSLSTFLSNPVIRYRHKEPIGVAMANSTHIDWNEKAFIVTAKISDKTQLANEAWGLIQDGVLKSFSIGGRVLDKMTVKEKDTGREITKITKMELYEVSVVDIPSNRKSFFSILQKSIEKTDYTCPDCGKEFEDEEGLKRHQANCPAKEATEDIGKPFAGYKDFNACLLDQKKKGKSKESAEKICGKLKAEHEKKEAELLEFKAKLEAEYSQKNKKGGEECPKTNPTTNPKRNLKTTSQISRISNLTKLRTSLLNKLRNP